MKPLNLDNRPCSPISSNCVIWQGDNIPCINLCTGDSVSDVVFKLATELCLIMDELDITNYDLDCLVSNSPAPESFQELIQLLITKVCNTNNIPVPPEKSGACPDCIVSVASCFVEGTQTTMQLVDYVQMIAEKVCDIIDEISIINNQIINLDNRVTILENTPPPTFTLPSISTNCLSDYMGFATTAPIDQILNTLLSNGTIGYCTLIQATGLPADLLTAVASQCITSTDLSLKSQAEGDSPINPMGTEYFGSWVNTPVTVADAITNIWLALCDLRTYVLTLTNTVVEAGDNITVTSSTVGNTTTYTINAQGGVSVENEGVELTPNVTSVNFVGDLVNATNVGDDVTVTINSFGGLFAQDPTTGPADLPYQDFSAEAADEFCRNPGVSNGGGVIQLIGEVYDDDNAYNPLTGIWTCPATGRYNLSCYAHYSRNEDVNGWYNPTYAGDDKFGMFGVGIFSPTGCSYYCANYHTITGPIRRIDVTAQAIGFPIPAGTQLCVKVWNLTGYDYVNYSGDVIRFSIQRIK